MYFEIQYYKMEKPNAPVADPFSVFGIVTSKKFTKRNDLIEFVDTLSPLEKGTAVVNIVKKSIPLEQFLKYEG